MNDRIFEFIEQLQFIPGSPEWRAMSESERVLATFAHFMSDHAADGLVNIVGSGEEGLYCGALDQIDAGWAAGEVRRLALIGDGDVDHELEGLYRDVEKRHSELWDAAAAYARTKLPNAPWDNEP